MRLNWVLKHSTRRLQNMGHKLKGRTAYADTCTHKHVYNISIPPAPHPHPIPRPPHTHTNTGYKYYVCVINCCGCLTSGHRLLITHNYWSLWLITVDVFRAQTVCGWLGMEKKKVLYLSISRNATIDLCDWLLWMCNLYKLLLKHMLLYKVLITQTVNNT